MSIESKAERAYKEKDYAEAIKYYIQITERDPTLKAAYYNLGLSYLQIKNYENAKDVFKKALELDEEYSDARYMLSLTYWYLKDYDQSEEEANELMLIDADRAKIMLNHINTARMR